MLRTLGLISVLAAAACSLDVKGGEGGFACEPDGSCRDGFTCTDSICIADPPACAAAVGTGDEHSCAIRTDGTAWCWGRNDHGQLGDNTTIDRVEPVQVVVADATTKLPRFKAISGGDDHSCALGDDGSVWCWGHGIAGQLGNNSTSDFHTPAKVAGLADAVAIATGSEHSCAIRGDRMVACWGGNGSGQLGIGGSTPQAAPAVIDSLRGVTAIAAGGDNTCAVDGDKKLWCWGQNERGQLGDGMRMGRATPGAVALPDIAGVAIGREFTCALSSPASGGVVSCFGRNTQAQLGRILFEEDAPTPAPISFKGVAVSIAAGSAFACLTDDKDATWCWGANDSFELADGTQDRRPIPARTAYRDAAAVAGGGQHSCAVSADGALRCTGDNARGQLGVARRTTQGDAHAIAGITDATAIAAGEGHTCATRMDGSVMCWGNNGEGELGDGTWNDRLRPVAVTGTGSGGVSALAVGAHHSCVLAGGIVSCWGRNSHGELGDSDDAGYTRGYPLPVPGLTGIEQIDAGGNTTCALGGGVVRCWGAGGDGQLGNNATANSDLPVAVQMLAAGVRGIAVGGAHACAINANRTVSCWGNNGGGQLGNGGPDGSALPVAVATLTSVDQIVAGDGFTCAHQADGVWCWGFGFNGEIGVDRFDAFRTPQHVTTLPATTKLAAGGDHACAIKSTGSLACWGASYSGEIGDGQYGNRGTPVSAAGDAMVLDVAAGSAHTCAVMANHSISCWGNDRSGQLGDGVLADTRPVAPHLPCP
jgi:alpha-tubulin suppressor-like RCC1 family protein